MALVTIITLGCIRLSEHIVTLSGVLGVEQGGTPFPNFFKRGNAFPTF